MLYKRNINKQCRSYSEIWDFWSKKWVYVQIQICIWRRCTWTFGSHLNMPCCARGFFLVQISPVIIPEGSQDALYVALLCRISGSLRLKVLCELKLSSSFRNLSFKNFIQMKFEAILLQIFKFNHYIQRNIPYQR